MKTIEEKARRYDEALEKAKELMSRCANDRDYRTMIYRAEGIKSIFPELAESKSEDEKIRKLLVEAVTQVLQDQYCSNRGVSKEKVVAWLERQGNNINCIYNCIYDKELSELLHIVICRYINDPNISYPERENVSKKILPYVELLEKQGEVESDNDDIEVEEKGIREAFNKIEDEKQCKQKPQRMISAEAKEAMYNKPADTVEQKCEESKTKIFDAPTPFEDKLYAFVLACEILVGPSKREFILEHSQEILDAAREQIGK